MSGRRGRLGIAVCLVLLGLTVPIRSAPGATDSGYWMLTADGTVYGFGGAVQLGDAVGGGRVDIEPTPSGEGYWILAGSGAVSAFGDATQLGNGPALPAGERYVSISASRGGVGYWLFTSRGRVFVFGDAGHFGDMAGVALNGPVLDSTVTPTGAGYWMVASDGGIFSFGDAHFFGSMGATKLNQPVMSMAADPDGAGYWLVASDGGIFAFTAPFFGSMGATPLNKPISGLVAPAVGGYLMVAEDGGIFAFGNVPFRGSLGANPPVAPVVSVAVLPEPAPSSPPNVPPPTTSTPSSSIPSFTTTTTTSPPATATTCFGRQATIVGTNGPDQIRLTPGQDVVVGRGGNDTIWNPLDTEEMVSASDTYPVDAPANDDFVCAGDGDDYVRGAQTVDAGSGNDRVHRGIDVDGGDGADLIISEGCIPVTVHGGSGDDHIGSYAHWEVDSEGALLGYWTTDQCAPLGADTIYGDGGHDVIWAGDGADRVYGGTGVDVVLGGHGDDLIQGWADNDILFGDNGNDSLDGGSESDRCDGNNGTDTTVNCEVALDTLDPSHYGTFGFPQSPLPEGQTLTVAPTAGLGAGIVTSVPLGIDCPVTACSATFPHGTEITLTAIPDGGDRFAGWAEPSGQISAGSCAGMGPCTFVMDDHIDVTARFEPIGLAFLTVNVTGSGAGTVTWPDWINCPPDCETNFLHGTGTMVTLSANPADGSSFAGWAAPSGVLPSGTCSGATLVCAFVVDDDIDIHVTATFEAATGPLWLTLTWGEGEDLDLIMTEPSGEEISVDHPQSASGGFLVGGGCGGGTETVSWPSPPDGGYVITIRTRDTCGVPAVDGTFTYALDGTFAGVGLLDGGGDPWGPRDPVGAWPGAEITYPLECWSSIGPGDPWGCEYD